MKKILLTISFSILAIFFTSCEALEELVKSSLGCMLKDAPNYNVSAILPCTTECIGDQAGNNCCCEEIVYGCMEPTAPNYSSDANAPCVEEVAGVETLNACCLESIIDCMEPGASNYNVLATVADNTLCTYASAALTDTEGNTINVVYGCMNSDACNHVDSATADCKQENAAITGSDWVQNDDCCDLNAFTGCYLDLDNNGYYEEANTTITTCDCRELGVGWVFEDEVADDMEVQGCTMPVNTGFSTFVDQWSPCTEFNPLANVDDGSCCLSEFNAEDYVNFDASSLDFMGVFNVEFTYGMLNDAGVCIADTMMDVGGPASAQLTLGPPNQSGLGQLQYFEEFIDELSIRTEWEFHYVDAHTESECFNYADENGSDYSYCANWGHDYQNCEEFSHQEDCPNNECFWETKFCHPTFEGQPCETYMNDMECYDNDCEWGSDPMNPTGGHCFTPFDEPWMHCWDLDEYDCEMSPDCELDGGDDFGGDFGDIDCMSDCPMYPDDMNWTQAGECTWLSDMVSTDCYNDCEMEITEMMAGMMDMLKMQKHLLCDDTEGDCVGFMGDGPGGGDGEGQCGYHCEYMYEDFCKYDVPVASDFSTCCPGFDATSCPSEQEENVVIDQSMLDACMGWPAGLTYGDCQGCSIKQIANVYSSYAATQTGLADTIYVPFPITAAEVVMSDSVNYGHFCGWIDNAINEHKLDYCDWDVQDLMYDLFDDCKACDSNSASGFQVNEADVACHAGVFGSGNFEAVDCSLYTDGPACNTITEHGQCICDQDCEWHPNPPNADGTPSQGGSCTDFGIDEDFIGGPPCLGDCTGSTWNWDTQMPEDSPEEFCNYIKPLYEGTCTDDCTGQEGMINCFGHICLGCMEIGNGMCNMMFGDDSDTLSYITEKLIKATKPQNLGLARSGACETGYLDDCSGDGDCCDETWLGDGYEDCADQAFGCDLSCYDNDGGDCEGDFGEQACVPSSDCFDYDYEGQCRQNGCAWVNDPFSNDSHCEPMPSFNPNACAGKPQTNCNQDEACQWNATAGPNDPANFEPHCGPQAPDDCFQFTNASTCDASISCEWDAPDWLNDWATGACFSHNPCQTPQNNNPDSCDNDPMCSWDWEYYECVKLSAGNQFCDCWVSHTFRSCEDRGGVWDFPPWATDCDDCDWIEKECGVPMNEQDCFHGYEDPCSQFFVGGNEHTEWVASTHTCTKSFAFSEAGTWALNVADGCLELNWEENEDLACTSAALQTEETCYCFDCEWKNEDGTCAEWPSSGAGRTTEQANMHNFQRMIYELSGSANSGLCFDYQKEGNVIKLIMIDDEFGGCQVVELTPSQPGS